MNICRRGGSRRRYRRRWAHSPRGPDRRRPASAPRAREHLRRIVLVEQRRADRIFAHRADAMGQHQPALVELDRRAAIAHLDELPRILRLDQQLAAFPMGDVVRRMEEDVLAVLPAEHHVLTVDLAREQRHALVARRAAAHRHQIDRAPVAGAHQLGLDHRAVIGGVGADPFLAAVVMGEVADAQILEPVRLRLGDREDHRARQRRIAVAIDRHRTLGHLVLVLLARRRRWRRAARARGQLVLVGDDAFAERHRRDMPLPHRAQRHEDAQRSLGHARLVVMRHALGFISAAAA
jgi:hypothetical protein